MSNVFVAQAEAAYEITQVIGVFSDKEQALQRCRDRPFADEEQTWQYDHHWVEEWEVDGAFLRSFDLVSGEVVEAEA